MLARRLLAPLVLAVAAAAAAQGPDADWRTVTTTHFRVHYPAPAEAWTLRAVARMEAIRERVAAEVGFAPTQVIDVVVEDPVAQPNGMALPLLDAPRMVLWTSPPGPDSAIGNYADWAEDLIVHEDVHTVHLLRPSRNPLHSFAERLLPLGPITIRAPRWVHEGYATYLEGQLTALGRPNGDLRASILRRWAQAGRLPSYSQMSNDSRGFLGMSMAYLVGSAYLEWLVERAGPDSPRHLWARLSARTNRDFDAAFEGVFGDPPATLYDEPAFGCGRVLEALLQARDPGQRFEVVNVAVTAINSHVIRSIARDCAARQGDVCGDLHGQQRGGGAVRRRDGVRGAGAAPGVHPRQPGFENDTGGAGDRGVEVAAGRCQHPEVLGRHGDVPRTAGAAYRSAPGRGLCEFSARRPDPGPGPRRRRPTCCSAPSPAT